MNLALIVAMSRDGLIGRDGTLPWRLPRDRKHFRRLTWGKPIIMGRKTHEALGRPLPGRTNIVLTRQADVLARGCLVARDRAEALALAQATGTIRQRSSSAAARCMRHSCPSSRPST